MYSDESSAKYLAGGTSIIPSWMSDVIIAEWIIDGDSYIDQATEKSENGWTSETYSTSAANTDVPRRIMKASKLLAASQILKALNGAASSGVSYKIKDMSVDRSKKQVAQLQLANSYIAEAKEIIKEQNENVLVGAQIQTSGVL